MSPLLLLFALFTASSCQSASLKDEELEYALRFHICDIPGICDEGEVCVPIGDDANCELVPICQENSCPEHQTCVENEDKETFTCVCPAGTTLHDEQCVPFCDLPEPCIYDLMECVPTNTSYDCVCVDGYSLYETQCVPVCQTAPCPDDMECLLELNTTGWYSCMCPDRETVNQTGECEKSCDAATCPENMQCHEEDASFSCSCGAGFRFTPEEECVAECEIEPCTGGESCVSYQGEYRCCAVGHLPAPNSHDCTPVCDLPDICEQGLECLADNINGSYSCVCHDYNVYDGEGKCVDFCQLDVCEDGMECSSNKNGFNCTCNGEQCERCEDNPCSTDFVCAQHDFVHECRCDAGYRLLGGRCVDVDECEDEVCEEGAECSNTDGGYYCTCPGGTYYNDYTAACSSYDECKADACDTVHTGMLCTDLPRGFACVCPPEFPEEWCVRGEEPCWCSEHEECVLERSAGNFSCQCNEQAVLQISEDGSVECLPDPDILPAANITLLRDNYTFNIGQSRHIQLTIHHTVKRSRPWELVSWEKVPGYVITTGAVRTPDGHFRTPYNRQMLVLSEVRPEDGGMYRVTVARDGYRTVSADISLTVNDVLVAEFGPKQLKGNMWKFQVKVNVADNLQAQEIRWYRIIGAHYELLSDNHDTCTYQRGGRTLLVPSIPATYLASFSGVLTVSGALVTGEVGFDANGEQGQ